MKLRVYHRYIGIMFILLLLVPLTLVLPSKAASHSFYDNYETITPTGTINVYYQSGAKFQYIQEALSLTNSSLRIIVGTQFYYNTSATSKLQIKFVDNSSGVSVTSQNLTIPSTGKGQYQYTYYTSSGVYLISRGSHLIRLIGMNSTPTAINYNSENGFSYYSNQTTGMGNWVMHSKQFLIQSIEEDVVNLTRGEIKSGRIDYPSYRDAIDAYLLYLPAQPVKIILTISTSNENLNLELYNYTNNGDMALVNSPVKTSGNSSLKILTYIPSAPKYYILLVKPVNYLTDRSDYTVRWINSSDVIDVTPPVVNFDNSTMTLDITGVYARMDGFTYNGTQYIPELARFSIYRELGNLNIRNGTLFDNDGNGEWTNTSIKLPGLKAGPYYVRATFKDNKGKALGISPKSPRFFVLGNLTVSPASISYIGGMTQKINVSGITVNNASSLDVFTYTIFDYNLEANTTISGKLSYSPTEWYARNIDVSTLSDGLYFVLGYFEDISARKYGIGNPAASGIKIFTVDQIINVTQVYVSYTDAMTQSLKIGGLAKTSFQGHGTGTPIKVNQSVVSFKIYNSAKTYTGISGNLTWTGNSWNKTIIVANLPGLNHYVQVTFTNNSQYYTASGARNSSLFRVNHILTITFISQYYVDSTSQIVAVEVRANTSYQGSGVGVPIANNPNARVLCTIVNNTNKKLTQVYGYAHWDGSSASWKANVSTASLLERVFYVMVNFSVISNVYNASSTRNSTTFLINHVLTLYVPLPRFNPDTATLDIIGIVATDSYSGYHHINSTTVKSTYFEIFNFSSKVSIGIRGHLIYNATFDDWRNMSIDLSRYVEGFYFTRVNISSIDVPEGAISNSTPFELVHKIIITGINLKYTAGFVQTLNITVLHAVSTYKYHSNITYANYRFYFQSNHTTVFNPNLFGNLTWTGFYWFALANVSKLPANGYYVMVNFADSTAANSKGSADTTNFTVIHSLSVSTPQINYLNNMKQFLNISCRVNSTYYYQRYFNSSNFGIGTYRIYFSNGTATSITGNLQWNGTYWVAKNADTSLLHVGSYRIKCSFSTSYAMADSSLSTSFSVTHIIEITKPTIIFSNDSKQLTILHVIVRSSFFSNGYLTNLTATTSYFVIFTDSNHSTGIRGQLAWNGTEWQIRNFAVPSLAEGVYYVKLYFNDSQTSLTVISSTNFAAAFPPAQIDWLVVAIILLIAIAVVVVLIWTFFSETPEKRSAALKKEV